MRGEREERVEAWAGVGAMRSEIRCGGRGEREESNDRVHVVGLCHP